MNHRASRGSRETAKLKTAGPIAERVAYQSLGGSAHLVFGVCGEELQCTNHEPELVGVGKFTDTHPEGHELVPRYVRCAFHDVLPHIVHSLFGRESSGGRRVSARTQFGAGGREMQEKTRCSKVARCDSAEEIQPLISDVLHGVSEARIFPSSSPTPSATKETQHEGTFSPTRKKGRGPTSRRRARIAAHLLV